MFRSSALARDRAQAWFRVSCFGVGLGFRFGLCVESQVKGQGLGSGVKDKVSEVYVNGSRVRGQRSSTRISGQKVIG